MTAPALFRRTRAHRRDPAIVDLGDAPRAHTYGEPLAAAEGAAASLLAANRRPSLDGARVAFLVPPSFDYTALLWGICRAGGIAVPLALAHPPPELEHVVDDCGAALLVADPALAPRLEPIAGRRGIPLLRSDEVLAGGAAELPALDLDQPALILYTSGTTGRPKGAVLSHGCGGEMIQRSWLRSGMATPPIAPQIERMKKEEHRGASVLRSQ